MAAPHAINHQDPNVLVWVAAQKIGLETLDNDPAWGRAIPNNATNGIGQNEVVRKMLNRVLEATASLAVSKPKLQVVAVALNIGNRWSGDNPTLTIAENGVLLPGLAAQMNEVWAFLRQMTYHQANIGDLSEQLTRSVYIYCVQKNLKRYNKWMPRLELFRHVLSESSVKCHDHEAFLKDLGSFYTMHKLLQDLAVDPDPQNILPGVCQGINEIIIDLNARVVGWVTLAELTEPKDWAPHFQGIMEWDPTKPAGWVVGFGNMMMWDQSKRGEWLSRLEEIMKGATPTRKVGEKFVEDFQEWVVQVTKSGAPPSIDRALKTLTSQQRHIQTLIDAAALPELRPLFVFAMTVEPVPATPNIQVTVPPTPATPTAAAPANRSPLAYIVRAMYESIKPRITSGLIEKEVLKLGDSLRKNRNTGTNNGVVHCECGLVAFLHRKSSYELATQFNYIGVSKLSCGPCHAWLTAYNKSSGRELNYYTGGTHGKWYPQWAVPPSLATTELTDIFSKIVCEQFVRYCDPNPHRMNLENNTGSTNPIHRAIERRIQAVEEE